MSVEPTTLPVQVWETDNKNIRFMSAGYLHNLAYVDDVFYSWGNDDFGQLGNGARDLWSSPGRVSVPW